MSTKKLSIPKYWVPILAVIVVIVHFVLVRAFHLTKWKGGGFGMYAEIHYYYNEVFIKDLDQRLDALILEDKNIERVMMDVKRMPNTSNLEKMAKIISPYVAGDTISIEVWKPLLNSRNASYSRELVNEFQYLKP